MPRRVASLLAAFALALSACQQPATASERTVEAPEAASPAKEGEGLKVAIFAGGCFWGVEGVFSHVKGVKRAVSGYHGGRSFSAKYGAVSSGVTDHAEAVRVVYDPAQVRYDQLLQIFFSVVTDPTLLNRQGPDVGMQYRSALVPMSAEQRRVATAYLKQMGASGLWDDKIVTRIENYKKFYLAEDYHQDFIARNPRQRYIVYWDKPKIAAFKAMYPQFYKADFLRDAK
ncbi:peptide-methionine (S)-S-oxide reductase MsrA [Erythrobacteraceae bacterium E2-1 Yellow Sea]|nr:peptide-methionine (S)-S-oxide reductase MsrA [Erythrobacteraceae bacterium E2-1 Yellow Sea]